MMRLMIIMLSLLVSLPFALSVSSMMGIELVKEVPPTGRVGEALPIRILLTNTREGDVQLLVRERIPGDVSFEGRNVDRVRMEKGERWYYVWTITLRPGETWEARFSLTPLRAGTLLIYPTEVWLDGTLLLSPSSRVSILCQPDGSCQPPGETSATCPEDCPMSGPDGRCDMRKDNRVDPDCPPGVDPDDPVAYEMLMTSQQEKGISFGILSALLVGMLILFLILIKKKAYSERV